MTTFPQAGDQKRFVFFMPNKVSHVFLFLFRLFVNYTLVYSGLNLPVGTDELKTPLHCFERNTDVTTD